MANNFDVDEQTFAEQVIESSRRQPVLVDFWASWCGPCQSLMPVLTRLADAYGGTFRLAKVEIDQQPGLASRYGVRSVPTVKLFRHGEVVDEFMGALPEASIRAFLDRHIHRESDPRMRAAEDLYRRGETSRALAAMRKIVTDDAENHDNRLRLAGILLEEGCLDEARAQLDALPMDLSMGPAAKALEARLAFLRRVEGAPDTTALEARLRADEGDSEARYLLALRRFLQGDGGAAMELLMELVRSDRRYGDDAGRKALLQVFALLGDEYPGVSEHRRRLAMLLN